MVVKMPRACSLSCRRENIKVYFNSCKFLS
jgi:hypothetical protein